ncbi:MAG TPA: hypothetical protein QF517_03220 [Pseudomonadales bacterium]|jgi:hypothetical protein|nr:hypothetical protein [Gammaproteobacteria bacterium]MDP6026677.1 hypothetical protein [Pseudomonadales bacterium]MDP7450914.1 hypothetical protein [Arenicellales bacterium]MDP7315367.1 hypothetical protein [Pseudomonadales bacterium]HJL60942.1 hypothetical protein [Pseudomonadales bacterium]|tara:strand:- start:1787 stop:2335 length:549 start_codon:yes stop_codon:yes gene_type:complete
MRSVFLFALAILLTGCGDDPETERVAEQKALKVEGQQLGSILRKSNTIVSTEDKGLTIQLIFGADSDLDLYVTDPLLETVYYANHQSRSGGRISADVKCVDPLQKKEGGLREQSRELRIEEIRFDAPISGRYRIGIDYPEKCDGGKEQAAYAVSVLHNGELIQNSGVVTFERFDVVVMEFDI